MTRLITRERLIILAVFTAGMTTLAIEITAARLLGTVFGTSNIVWANIIGLILIYLAAGYFIGGRWADRSPYADTFYRIIAWGAFTAGLVPLISRPVLRQAAVAVQALDAAIMVGSFISVLVLFVVPITLLGCVSPFAIRLSITETAKAGRTSGRVYAVSTVGSILGTFLPVLWLIPTIGTARTFLLFSLVLLLMALGGLAFESGARRMLRYAWMPIALIGLSALALSGPIKDGSLYETESSYNYIQVVENDGVRLLYLNEGLAEHSIYLPEEGAPPYGYGTWEMFLVAPFFNPAPVELDDLGRVGLIGLAGGTIAKQYSEIFGPVPIDGWEIDPEIIRVGREYFDMNEPNLNAIVADGRTGLEQSEHLYSVIAIDAYRAPYIPWELTSVEFFQNVADHLEDRGVLAINVGRTAEDRRLIEALAGTIQAVFPSVYLVDVPGSFNSLLYATREPTQATNLVENLLALEGREAPNELIDVLNRATANIRTTPETDIVFTDDRAPVEQLINSIVLQFVLGGMEGLP
ncbi:MAG: fused MFS/spermidine synthase [Chloroflexi bacterium]|nr:fused MFS/spermidine synthase [Chloroflexota bacterium]